MFDPKAPLEIGGIYKVHHQRKGHFTVKISFDHDDVARGEVVEGKINAVLEYNVKEVGESVDFKKSLCFNIKRVEEAA